ncbi:MAG: bifunctional diaminohydroxyphosphoribosylaminopyrimidine deaminase/5-amino-6-(5-phosphoribosylamino)uracil reductase RibD [Mariniphaga sp.]|jgi:diaminohydroxyphosphoribosylaminopyrimidine deaminase/5-amino-6-(5-phosphoribosylamino)uracil reductase|nr:bifunctional diaminohydroxyphosphoribosylaminopyrimidine deaminase/5-amino-6-(5-phosphoribosylamino)uracil reductase RibD [Mariniphaga sp.]
MEVNEKYMKRCIELARLGAGSVAPNPMVGCVLVCQGKIIGEGFHQKYGGAHAEVNAINAVSQPELLKQSTLYVSLEPCAHHGLTPPCSDLIVEKQIPKVVIGTIDPFSEVAGKGVEKLRKAGIEAEVGILEKDCRELNKRFFTFHEKKRPYVILKWAQTLDGFIDTYRKPEDFGKPTWITGDLALRLVHKIRSEEGAILVGTNTAEKDNPSLTVRHWTGKNPVRAVLDKNLRLSPSLHLFDGASKTLVFNAGKNESSEKIEWIKIDFKQEIVPQILHTFYHRKINSVIVEGGKQMLDSFIRQNLWDEAHIFIGNKFFHNGVSAPEIQGKVLNCEILDNDWLKVLINTL